ncbi:MAG: xylulokinase [Rhodospirillales bacterium]|nr:xylulokinase [Rhodospirillales bacterium]
MACFLGIDLGTSAVKALIVDEQETVRAEVEERLATTHPAPLASEQDPDSWWRAVQAALARLRGAAPEAMAQVAAIGLAGQMHATVLLDDADRPVRPAMLWNDGRAHAEATELKRLGTELAAELGVPALAGFTAPKLLWLARHEPATLARARSLLLPKDLIRLYLTGERATDPSDAAGTWLLDEARRGWSARAIAAVGLDPALLPRIVEGTAPTGTLRPEIARRFGLSPRVVVAAGGGDTMAGGVGIGAVEDGRAFVGLSTSAQLFVAANAHRPAPAQLVHAFCHAVPGRWCQMAAMLNGAGVLASIAHLLGDADIPTLLAEAEARFAGPGRLLVLPYLSGERTPHDDPHARGVVFGLTPDTTRAELVLAALEGVAFSFADARDALAAGGTRIASAGIVGGGARSAFWTRLIASVLGVPLRGYAGGARGPAFGAARLGRLALGAEPPSAVLAEPPVQRVIEPDTALADAYAPRIAAFRRLYAALRPEFAA